MRIELPPKHYMESYEMKIVYFQGNKENSSTYEHR